MRSVTCVVGAGLCAIGLGCGPALAQNSVTSGLPSGFIAPGLPFGPTSNVPTVQSPTPTMAIANPGGLSFAGATSVTGAGLSTLTSGSASNAGGLRFSGGTTPSGLGAGIGATGALSRRPLDDVTGSIGRGGGAPAGAGIAGAGLSRSPTDAYFDPLSGSGLR